MARTLGIESLEDRTNPVNIGGIEFPDALVNGIGNFASGIQTGAGLLLNSNLFQTDPGLSLAFGGPLNGLGTFAGNLSTGLSALGLESSLLAGDTAGIFSGAIGTGLSALSTTSNPLAAIASLEFGLLAPLGQAAADSNFLGFGSFINGAADLGLSIPGVEGGLFALDQGFGSISNFLNNTTPDFLSNLALSVPGFDTLINGFSNGAPFLDTLGLAGGQFLDGLGGFDLGSFGGVDLGGLLGGFDPDGLFSGLDFGNFFPTDFGGGFDFGGLDFGGGFGDFGLGGFDLSGFDFGGLGDFGGLFDGLGGSDFGNVDLGSLGLGASNFGGDGVFGDALSAFLGGVSDVGGISLGDATGFFGSAFSAFQSGGADAVFNLVNSTLPPEFQGGGGVSAASTSGVSSGFDLLGGVPFDPSQFVI